LVTGAPFNPGAEFGWELSATAESGVAMTAMIASIVSFIAETSLLLPPHANAKEVAAFLFQLT
jgi:hypothetical protein